MITGASRGIGRAAALKFAAEGCAVAVNFNQSREAAEEVCAEIKRHGGMAEAICADVSDSGAAERMVAETVRVFGGLDVLVNNAGIALPQGLFCDFGQADAERVFDVNVFGMMNCCRAAIPHFVHRHSGKIVNVSSVWGVCGGSCEVIYSASKAAVIGFTKALSRELAPSGINVNCVAPGMIDTDMNAHLSEDELEEFRQEIPLMRIGTPQNAADAICYLASDKADYITGQVLSVDGGIA